MKKILSSLFLALSICTIQSQSPGGVSSGLRVWLKGDAGTSSIVDGSFLSSWNDQSSNGNNATQSTGSAQPKYIRSALNNNPAIESNGGTRFFNVNLNSIDNNAFTVFTVIKRAGSSSQQFVVGIQQSTPSQGLNIGYNTNTQLRHGNYGNTLNLAVTNYNAATESPRVLIAECNSSFNKTISEVKDGVLLTASNTNTNHYTQGAQGVIGRGWNTSGFQGYISEVIVYNRVLSALEKQQVQTYLSIKYGISIQTADHLYYNEPSFSGDIVGIGKATATQGLNQTESTSENSDDILTVKSPSNLNDGEYLVFGNNNASTAMPVYSGINCQLQRTMNRTYKVRETGDVGTVTLRFDMTGITGFNGSKLLLLVDTNGDGFDDETGLTGTYTAPWFEVTDVDLADGQTLKVAMGESSWYAVLSGNSNAAIWADTPNGTPQIITTFCSKANIIINSGVNVTFNWPSFACNSLNVNAGGIVNAGSTVFTVSNSLIVDGIFNAQTSTINMNGTANQVIRGSGIVNVFNLNINNPIRVTIQTGSGGVRARNLIQVNSGEFRTNGLLTLVSDASSTGMIGPLVTGTLTGNVTVNRYHNAIQQGWVNICSPIQSKTVADWNDDIVTTGFAGSDYPPPYPFNNVQYYNEPAAGNMNQGFVGVTNTTNALLARRGYFIFLNAGAITLDVDGTINSGNQSMPMTYTNTGNVNGDGWNMIANPYPCTIDWDAAAWTKTNMSNAVYVWNAAIGQYATYVGGTSANGGSRYIPSTQSFFVKASAASPVLTMTENCKATVQGTFKDTENNGEVLTLHISNGTYSDETTLAHNSTATLAFESNLDAYKLRSPLTEVPYMATIDADGSDISVNTFGQMVEETIIPLRIEVGTSGVYQLTTTGLREFAKGACLVIENLATGEEHPLTETNAIELNLQAGVTTLQYQLKIGATSIAQVTTAGCSGSSEGTASVQVDSNGPYTITWINGDSEVIHISESVTSDITLADLSAGNYTVQISGNGACGATESEIYIPQSEMISATGIIVAASCQNDNDGGIALDLNGGNGVYDVTWSNGDTSQSIENLEAGTYTAFVADQNNCTNTFHFVVPIRSVLEGSFTTLEDTYELINGSARIDFYNTSENATDFVWIFGDNTIINSETNPTHVYNALGVYNVTMISSNEDCDAQYTKTIHIVPSKSNVSEFSSEIIGRLTDEGVKLMFFFEENHRLKITAYNLLGQQLIDPIVDNFTNETITFSTRKYAANSLVEIVDLITGDRTTIKMGR